MDHDIDAAALAVITGASSPMAIAISRQLSLWQFDLLLVAEDEGVDWVTRLLQSEGCSADGIKADLRTNDGVNHVCAEIIGRGQQVQLLVLNSGIMLARRLLASMVQAGSGCVLVCPDAPPGLAGLLRHQLAGTEVSVSVLRPVQSSEDPEEYARRAIDALMMAEIPPVSRAL